ncbi:hypothetical protein [Romboutsia sp.]|uniref:hypothetical protein n=1 Tax=Romboutsia sp. TaxID=1965302 RepID=UPI003F3E1EB3
MKIPYWRWLCNSKNNTNKNYLVDIKSLMHNWINGELLVGISDRLKSTNINDNMLTEALEKILLLYKEYDQEIDEKLDDLIEIDAYGIETIEQLININDFKVIYKDLEKFISLLKECEEEEYSLLQELSNQVFDDIKKVHHQGYLNRDKLIETIENIKDSILIMKNLLKDDILENQMSYFDEYIEENKGFIHLGYKVYCMEFMDRFINQNLEFYIPNKKEYGDINFTEKMYIYLLDWDGEAQ